MTRIIGQNMSISNGDWNKLCWLLRIPIDSDGRDLEKAIQNLLDTSLLLADSLCMAFRGDIEYVDEKVFETRPMIEMAEKYR